MDWDAPSTFYVATIGAVILADLKYKVLYPFIRLDKHIVI